MGIGGPEIEALALDAAGHEAALAGRHSLPRGAPCPNCGVVLQGPWCHACGQKADDYHRSLWRLLAEVFEGLTELDGRLWRTLWRLVRRPGRLTFEYVEGHRASQLPPFRLFLIMVLIVFFAGNASFRLAPKPATPAPASTSAPAAAKPAEVRLTPDTDFRVSLTKPGGKPHPLVFDGKKSEAFNKAIEDWSHQFALLSVVVMAPAVALLFIRRKIYFFDHLIFALHSLSFQGAAFVLSLILRDLGVPGNGFSFLAIPVHLFFHLRGAYGLTIAGALWRTLTLVVLEVIGFVALMIGLILIAVAATG